MLPLNHVINSTTFLLPNIITTSSAYHPVLVSKQRRRQQQQQQTRRRRTTTSPIITTIPRFSVNITHKTPFLSSSTSSSQPQHISLEDSYSPKTGIKTAALLGGMLVLVIVYLIWKARARLCRPSRSSSTGVGNARVSATKFDLDYWLKQVDILEAKEAERNRGGQSLYLELPSQDPRNNREATASWIVDAYRQWRLLQYRRQQQLFLVSTHQQVEVNPSVPYRRRRNLMRRFVRRYFSSTRQSPSFLMEHSSSLIAGMRPSIVSNHFVPPLLTSNLQLRRANSWPRMKSTHYQTGAPMSALQTHLARKRLLKRTSRTTLDI